MDAVTVDTNTVGIVEKQLGNTMPSQSALSTGKQPRAGWLSDREISLQQASRAFEQRF